MSAYQEASSLEQPLEILANCTKLNPLEEAYTHHPVIARFGSPEQIIYIDEMTVTLNGIRYEQPLILPVFNAQLELVQCAVLQDKQPVKVIPEGFNKGFSYYGNIEKNQPIIIAYNLEEFFKISQTGYAVVLVVSPNLCKQPLQQLKAFDFELIKSVVNQLSYVGYTSLYMPVRPEHIKLEAFQELEKNTSVCLINQYLEIEESTFQIDLNQYDSTEEVIAFINEAISQLPVSTDLWQEPKPINTELQPVKPLTSDMLPMDLNIYCLDEARRADNMTPDLIAVCLLTSLGSLIGARVGVKPKQLDDYLLVPNLWGGIIAPPSSKKSPAIKAGTRHLDHLVLKAKDTYQNAKQENIAKGLVFKSNEKTLNKSLDKATNEQEKLSIAQQIADMQAEANSEPILKRYFTNDSSPEALAELEKGNPNGILVIRDELVGWLSSLDQNDTDTGRAFYLEGWNGTGSYQFDRIMRGSGFIENHCLSVLGGIQPDKLMSYLEKTIKGQGNDGLLQRFQLLIFPDLLQWEYVDQAINKEARGAVFSLFEAIDQLTEYELVRLGAKPTDEFNSRPYFRFSVEAQQCYKQWSERINGEVIPNEEHSIIQEHLTKYGKLMPSLALIFHIIDCVQVGSHLGGISIKCTEMAIQWCEYLESHARRIYGLVLQSSMIKAKELIKKLTALKLEDKWRAEGFSARDVHRKNWKSLTDIDSVNDVLDILVEHYWLSVKDIESTVKGGRPTKLYKVNPKIFL